MSGTTRNGSCAAPQVLVRAGENLAAPTGTGCRSDDGNRWLFHDSNSDSGLSAQPPCAARLTARPVVEALWARPDHTEPRPDLPLTGDPDLHLLADGARMNPVWQGGGMHLFHLLARPGCVRVRSRSATPQELGLARDPRPLGVALRRIVLRQGPSLAVLEADDPLLAVGFHGFEPELRVRWTDGDALLPAAPFTSFNGRIEVALHLGGTMHYPAEAVELAA